MIIQFLPKGVDCLVEKYQEETNKLTFFNWFRSKEEIMNNNLSYPGKMVSCFSYHRDSNVISNPFIIDDISLNDITLYSPLNFAIKTGHYNVIAALLENGANPLLKDSTGVSPYGRALLQQASTFVYEKINKVHIQENSEVYREYWGKILKVPIELREKDDQVIITHENRYSREMKSQKL